MHLIETGLAFTGNPLDRAGNKRSDPAWLAAKRAEAGTRVLLLWKTRPFLNGSEDSSPPAELAFLDGADATKLGTHATEVFLGLMGETAYFARDISELAEPMRDLRATGHFRPARECLPLLSAPHLALVAQAKALLDWHARHRFCAVCGAPTRLTDGGYRRSCTACKTDHFPRTDPCVIMLVTRENWCLLARNKRFTGAHNHSTLAGFIEPGESIEEAVRREVFEEVGIETGAVHYFAAQPWPFPSSLMIGCYAEAKTHDIRIDGNEIVSARWFERDIVRRLIAGENFENVKLPRVQAIAYHLIRNWAQQ
ncbi:MAG: NAD(+) diphosphatase [Proteobacteria bacterium]|nr:NAD(+) diphosphatase [Pseudomonadota bacterium]